MSNFTETKLLYLLSLENRSGLIIYLLILSIRSFFQLSLNNCHDPKIKVKIEILMNTNVNDDLFIDCYFKWF